MPWSATLVTCALLVGGAAVLASQSLALAADGAFQLVRVLGSEDVYGSDARILGAWAHQGAVVVAARAGATDTQQLAFVLGIGQLLLPAVAWSLAIVLSREDRLVCAAVSMIAALNAGATWFLSVSEIVLAVPLTTLVAMLLWQPRTWRRRELAIAVVASAVLVASYETALLTGAVLGGWALWRARRASVRVERYGTVLVAALSLLSVLVAIAGIRSGSNPTHSQSLLYFVVSLEPWPFYVALAGIAAVIAALGPWLHGYVQRVMLGVGCAVLVVAVVGLEPDAVTAFQARGGAAVSGFVLELFLLWRWMQAREGIAENGRQSSARLSAAVPVVFAAAMLVANVQPVRTWSRSLDAFRAEVDRTDGTVEVAAALPPERRAVVWGWTSSSLSLLLRGDPSAGILIDRDPSLVPFPPDEARAQLGDEYTWSR
jgi:hypothetical protein